MSYEDRIHEAAENFAHELDVPGFDTYRPATPEDAPRREAFHRGVGDGTDQGPRLHSRCLGVSYEDPAAQKAYDIGTHIGFAIWEANQ